MVDKKNPLTFEMIRTKIPFLACLSEKEFQDLKAQVKEGFFMKESVIVPADDAALFMYIILSGAVKVVNRGEDGKERIVAIHKAGDYYGEMALIDGKTSPATVKAMKHSTVILVPKKVFHAHLLKKKKVLAEFNLTLCQRLRESWATIKILGIPDAEERVRAFLKYMSTYGTQVFGGKIIKGQLTHQTIADHLSLTRETVTRVLNKLEKSHEIEMLGGKTILFKEQAA